MKLARIERPTPDTKAIMVRFEGKIIGGQRVSTRLYSCRVRRKIALFAPKTRATAGLYMLLKILGIVIVHELFSGPYCTLGKDIDATVFYIDLAIGSARVIDESCGIAGNVTVDHGLRRSPEEIQTGICLDLPFSRGTSDVFDDARAAWNGRIGKKPSPCARAPHVHVSRARDPGSSHISMRGTMLRLSYIRTP